MANSPQARKRVRRNDRFNAINIQMKNRTRTHMRTVLRAIADNDKAKATELFKQFQGLLGRLRSKKLLHKNTVARLTKRFNQKLKAMA